MDKWGVLDSCDEVQLVAPSWIWHKKNTAKKGTRLWETSEIWFMVEIFVLNRHLRIHSVWGYSQQLQLRFGHMIRQSVRQHTPICANPSCHSKFAFIIIPSSSSLNPAEVTALALVLHTQLTDCGTLGPTDQTILPPHCCRTRITPLPPVVSLVILARDAFLCKTICSLAENM